MALFWRLGTGAVLLLIANPAAAQTSADTRIALETAAPLARKHCLARAAGRDQALLACLRFRNRFPLNEWRDQPDRGVPIEMVRPLPLYEHPDTPERYLSATNPPLDYGSASAADVQRCRAENSAAEAI